MSELIAFRGRTSCRRANGPLKLALAGATLAHPQQLTRLEFATSTPPQLPATLEDARVADLGGGDYRITSAAGEWHLRAAAVHLHRDVAHEFYGALPPRPVPRGKRLFWRLVLALAGSRAGLSALRALRG